MTDETLNVELDEEFEQEEVEQEELEESADVEAEADDESEEDDVVVTIGDEKPAEEDEEVKRAPKWVKELRKEHREAQRKIREYEGELKKLKAPAAPAVPALGKKPTLEDCDYDAEKFEADLTAWHERKRQADQAVEDQRKQEEAQQQAWQKRVTHYTEKRKELGAKDFEDAENTVQSLFDDTRQGIIVQGADNPALVVYALGKNPAKAKELAAITDPIQFAFAVAKLETQMKVQGKKAPPAPEKTVSSGTARISGAVDSHLERLRAEAEKTGDMSKVLAYKRQQRQKAG